jgi:hypothetical protein
MTNNSSHKSKSGEHQSVRVKITTNQIILLFGLVAILCWVMIDSQRAKESPAKNSRVQLAPRVQPRSQTIILAPTVGRPEHPPAPLANKYVTLTNQVMRLTKKVLTTKKWNSGEDSFGLDKPPAGQQGATVGPAAVAYLQGKIYVLDNANKRILGYDQAGSLVSSVALPNSVATDLSVEASGSSLVLFDHLNNRVYKVEGNELTLLGSVPLKEGYPLGTKFAYDAASNTLSTQEVHQDGLADIEGNNLILGPKTGEPLAITFDKPVACVEEVVTDANGIVWVLYTLEGDYQMRRIARVDRAHGTVGLAEIDVWFAFDATRHMAATGNGVVLFAGDNQEGRLVAFDHAGVGY